MTEPARPTMRPTIVKRLRIGRAVPALVVLAVAGCGQQATPTSAGSTASDKVGSCATDAAGVVRALPVYQAIDLDHDGVGNSLMVTRADSTCPNVMFSKVAGRYASLDLGQVRLDLKSAQRVIVPERDGDLMAIREVYARGGFQVHLYGYADGRLAEVTTSDGDVPVPFVATDTRGGYVSTSCVDNGFVVRRAVAHRPPGVVATWDIREASYTLEGTTAKPSGTKETRDNVLDGQLAKDYPELVGREMFRTGCTA